MDSDPQTIGRYRIVSVVGRGAMGIIYRAHDPEIDRPLAIKLIRADLLSSDDRDNYIIRFRREAQAAGRCVHPNIVAIYDFALHEGNPFLAMEFVDGSSLNHVHETGAKFGVNRAVAVIAQVLDALAAAHKTGIIHRDIKPANILLVGGSLVKVTDFGISHVSSSELTSEGQMIGTPSYMSPEQCRGLAIDARSDLFSTGVLLYELLCGERPFGSGTPAAVMHRLLNEEARDISSVNPAVGPALKSIVDRALAKSPSERFSSASEMAATLRALPASPSAPAMLSDRTVIMTEPYRGTTAGQQPAYSPAPEPIVSGETSQFDGNVLVTIERKLAHHLGPMARVVLRSAIHKCATVEALCDSLATNIAGPTDRERFRAEALAELQHIAATQSGPTATPVSSAIPVAERERAEKELINYLGPIARVLVRRAAGEARSVAELWRLLAHHLERDNERSDFLKRGGVEHGS